MRTSLVTGGAGFIGSHLVKYFARRGLRVLEADLVADYETSNYFKIIDSSIDFRSTS